MFLSNVGGSQRARFDRLGQLTDLEDSILNLQQAVSLPPTGIQTRQRTLLALVSASKHVSSVSVN